MASTVHIARFSARRARNAEKRAYREVYADEIDEMIRQGDTLTDWERVRNLTDEEIEASIDFKDEGTFDFSRAQLGLAAPFTQRPMVEIDEDLIDWFKAQGINLG